MILLCIASERNHHKRFLLDWTPDEPRDFSFSFCLWLFQFLLQLMVDCLNGVPGVLALEVARTSQVAQEPVQNLPLHLVVPSAMLIRLKTSAVLGIAMVICSFKTARVFVSPFVWYSFGFHLLVCPFSSLFVNGIPHKS